jgi:glycolate oxidase FAD binding subunit
MDKDLTTELRQQVADAIEHKQPLRIVGGDTKRFLGRKGQGEGLSLAEHRGICNYDPSELTITARAGTPLSELEQVLADSGQMLPFEPPHFGDTATLGGTIACNLSGPRRPYAGAARDFVLGSRIINGKGEALHFGGEVIKNVAGYDVSRLMAGAFGTLGVLLEISLKVLPAPATSRTLSRQCSAAEAIQLMNTWAGQPYPMGATCFDGEQFFVRLEGAGDAVSAAVRQLGGDEVSDGEHFWQQLREQKHDFFNNASTLWRIATKPTAPMSRLPGKWLLEWGGAQRWYLPEADVKSGAAAIRNEARQGGGHATLFRHAEDDVDVFHPLDPVVRQIHHNLKQAFDPDCLFNPGRMYEGL